MSKTSNGLVLFREADLDAKLALIAQYDKLPYGERKSWRDHQNADSAILTYYRTKYLNAKPPTAKRKSAAASIIDIQPINEVSLADAILAMEVKQHHMNEFIEELKRIRKGGR